MKKNDFILAGSVVVFALLFLLIYRFCFMKQGPTVRVTVDGEVFGEYSLAEDQEIDINGTNTLTIADGKADMTWADCPDKLCVHQSAIDSLKQTIVCLPNKIVVEVISGDEAELDTVAK